MLPNIEYIKTLVNGLKEFVNSKIKLVRNDIDSLPQADWNQSDSTAKDYVKNRTHYVERQQTSIAGAKYTATYNGTEHDPLPFALGQVWNADFETRAFDNLEVKQAGDTLYIGDLTLNQIPFYVTKTSGRSNSGWANMAHPGELTLTCVSGTVEDVTVHTLDPKYIKDMYHTETQEYEVGTAMSGWWNVTNGGSNPIIPKMRFCGVVYKYLVPSNVDGIDYYYIVGDYTFRFHAAQGEEYRYMTIDPHYDGSYDSIIFYAINEVVTPIPNKYIINSDFIIAATVISEDSKTVTLDKTFDQIREAIRDGKRAVIHIANTSESENGFSSLQLLINDSSMIVFSGTEIMGIDYSVTITIAINKKNEVRLFNGLAPVMRPEGTFPQLEMFQAPTRDMQIATKKYVDDKEFILQSTTPNSTKKFKITVDDSGTITTMEV